MPNTMKCLVHPECKASVKVDGIALCYECWNKATLEERQWFEKAINLYNRGLTTKQEFEDTISIISYHNIDPTIPVHI